MIASSKKRSTIVGLLLLSAMIIRALPVRLYDKDLLSSNLITALCQDAQGYIWIGTEYGLNKFDGAHVTQYYNADTQAGLQTDDIVRRLMTDRDGTVWVVYNMGVQRYNRLTNSFESVKFDDVTSANITDILQSPDGHIWLLGANVGVFEVGDDLQAREVKSINRHLKGACGKMFLDSKGRLWINYSDTGLQMIDTKTGKTRYFKQFTADVKRTSGLVEDAKHQLFTLTIDRLLKFNEEKQEFEEIVFFPGNNVTPLCPLKNGHLLFGTSGNGLWEIDPVKREVTTVQVDDDNVDLDHQKVHALMQDRNGSLWVGCYQKGLMKISNRPTPFHYQSLSRLQNYNDKALRSVFADSKGDVFVCYEGGGVVQVDKDGRALSHWMKDYTVMTLHEDAEGAFWVGTYRNGMFRIHPQTGREEWFPQTGSQRIGSITQDREGNLYTAVFDDGLRSYTPDGKTERTLGKGRLKLSNIFLNTLFTDKDGRIWIGHYYGIDVYDPKTDQLVDVNVDAALRPAIVYAIGQGPDGSIWVGSNKGLFRYNGQWQHYTTKEGLPNIIVCGLVITADNTVWASTYKGLCQIDSKGRFTSYYRGNGLQECSYQRSVYAQTIQGEILMGHQNGVTRFDPKKIVKDQFEQGITLTGMRLGNIDVDATTLSNGSPVITSPLDMTDEITVSYLDNTFSLLFSTMDFRNAQNVHYEYRFKDEPNDVWHQTTAGVSEIFLSRLSYGNHLLQVRAYSNGSWSAVKTLTIHVTPPWYRSWWAYLLYLLVLVVIVVLWWHSYWNKRQAEINEEKIKFFVDISHELRSPLTLIKSPLNQLLRSSHDAVTTRALRNMERNTNRLLTLTDQILSIRKIEKGQLTLHFSETRMGDFITDIYHDYDYLLEQRQLNLTFDNQAPEMKVWLDVEQFDKVVANLIGNAIKYVKDGGEIVVKLRQTADGFAELSVCDNGPGINEEQLRKVFERFYQASARPVDGQMSYGIGLNLTHKIVTMHHGTISARNRTDGQGSEFIVRLPLGCEHLPQEQLLTNEEPKTQNEELAADGNTGAMVPSPKKRQRKKTSYHIAVVDDEEEICTFLYTELGETYNVHTFPNGQKALEYIVDKVPDLVISDVVMPLMDGYELLKRVKSNTKTSHIPVILLTTKTDHDSRIEGIEQGADAYIDKPFNLDELEARIAGLIANRIRVRGKFSGIQEQADAVRQIELKGNDEALMERIMAAVNKRLDDSDYNVESLAEDVGLSRTQLHRRVKELTGISVGEFIRNLRLQQAAKLLAAGDVSVSQVAYAVGFATPGHFTVTFKKHFGVPPSEYMTKSSSDAGQE